ncbi:MAG: CHAD domain-containing protein [Pseudomonadota bacterium]
MGEARTPICGGSVCGEPNEIGRAEIGSALSHRLFRREKTAVIAYHAPQFSLSLTGAPADLAALARAPLLGAALSGDGPVYGARRAEAGAAAHWRRRRAAYFDTDDYLLARNAMALWREETGVGVLFRRRRQDFFIPALLFASSAARPGEGGEGPFAREALANTAADLARVDVSMAQPFIDDVRLPPDAAERLRVAAGAYRTIGLLSCDQWSAILLYGDAVIEAVITVGRAEETDIDQHPPHRSFAELSLGLLSGAGEGLFDLARALIEDGRGRLHLSGGAPYAPPFAKIAELALQTPLKAGAAEGARAADVLTDGVQTSAANLCVAASHLCGGDATIGPTPRIDGAANDELTGADVSDDDVVGGQAGGEAGRRARVAMRRFRAFEKVFRKSASSPYLRSLAEKARDYARLIGAGRDWDVFLGDTLPALDPLLADIDPDGVGRLRLRRAGAVEQGRRWRTARTALQSTEFAHFLLDFVEAGLLSPWREGGDPALYRPTEDFARLALDKAYQRARVAGEAATLQDMETMHGLRLELKKFRYAAQIFRGLYPKEARKPFFLVLAELQDRLGKLNDAVVAQRLASEALLGAAGPASERVGQEAESAAALHRAAGFVAGAKASTADAAARDALPLWEALLAMPAYWRSSPGGVDPFDGRDASSIDEAAPAPDAPIAPANDGPRLVKTKDE